MYNIMKIKKAIWLSGSMFVVLFLLLGLVAFHGQSPQSPLDVGLASAAEKPAAEAAFQEEVVPAEEPAAREELLRSLQVQVEISNKGNSTSNNITLRIPMLADVDSPYQNLLGESFSHKPVTLEELEMRGRIMVVEIPSLAPGSSETIVLDYTVDANGTSVGDILTEEYLAGYLQASSKVESEHPEIIATALGIVEGLDNDRDKVEKIYSFVTGHLEYDKNELYRNKGALSALRTGRGVCEEYATLFVGLSRAAGVPARVVNGYTDPRGTGEVWDISPGESFSLNGYRHAWAEFYVEDEGWLPVDPTMENGASTFKYFGSLPSEGYIIQNYQDEDLSARFRGGSLAVTWDEQLVNN